MIRVLRWMVPRQKRVCLLPVRGTAYRLHGTKDEYIVNAVVHDEQNFLVVEFVPVERFNS